MTINDYIDIEIHWPWHRNQVDKPDRDGLITRFCHAREFQQKLAQWQAIRNFEALDDHHLQDIGIERYEIRDFVIHGKR